MFMDMFMHMISQPGINLVTCLVCRILSTNIPLTARGPDHGQSLTNAKASLQQRSAIKPHSIQHGPLNK